VSQLWDEVITLALPHAVTYGGSRNQSNPVAASVYYWVTV